MRFIYQILTILLITSPFIIFSNPIIGLAIILGWLYARKHSVKKVVVYLEKFSIAKTVKQDWKGYMFTSFFISSVLFIPITVLGSVLLLAIFVWFFPELGDFLYRCIFHLAVNEEGDFNWPGIFLGLFASSLTIFLSRKLLLPKRQIFLLIYLMMIIIGVIGHYVGYGYTYNNGTILNSFTIANPRDVHRQYAEQEKVEYVEDEVEIEEVSFDREGLKKVLQTVVSQQKFGPFDSSWLGKNEDEFREKYGDPNDREFVKRALGKGDEKYIYGNYSIIVDEFERNIKEIWYVYDYGKEDISFEEVKSIIGEPLLVDEKMLTYYTYKYGEYQMIFEVRGQRVVSISFLPLINVGVRKL